jgi:hypothetical protein
MFGSDYNMGNECTLSSSKFSSDYNMGNECTLSSSKFGSDYNMGNECTLSSSKFGGDYNMEYVQMKHILRPLKLGGCYKIDKPNFSNVKLESIKIG